MYMEDKQKKFLDKVVEFLINDSEINYSNRNWWLTSPWIQGGHRTYPHLGRFHDILPYTLNSTNESFGKYCKNTYGLSDSEIYSVWRSYRDEMWKRYYELSNKQLGINESDDKQKKFLDKVVEHLVKDTIIDFDKLIIFYPFLGSDSIPWRRFTSRDRFSLESPFSFDTYINDTYSVMGNDIDYVWRKYISILEDKFRSSENINESEDKQNKFLDKVVEFIVKDTEIDYENERINFPFFLVRFSFSSSLLSDSIFGTPPGFSTYCKDTYGLTRKDIDYVWEKYRNIINDKINNKGSINESEDKQKKYLDKVVEFLVKDTEIKYDYKIRFFPPFLWESLSVGGYLTKYEVPQHFREYCEKTYGLNNDESQYVWNKYSTEIIFIINNM